MFIFDYTNVNTVWVAGRTFFWLIIRIGYPNGLLFLSLFNILTELYLGVVQGHTFHFEIFSGTLYPYWQILVNSSRKFSEISGFRGHELDRFLENSSINFLWVPFQFLYNIGAWPKPISGKLIKIWSVLHPGIHQKLFFDYLLCLGWVFQRSV